MSNFLTIGLIFILIVGAVGLSISLGKSIVELVRKRKALKAEADNPSQPDLRSSEKNQPTEN